MAASPRGFRKSNQGFLHICVFMHAGSTGVSTGDIGTKSEISGCLSEGRVTSGQRLLTVSWIYVIISVRNSWIHPSLGWRINCHTCPPFCTLPAVLRHAFFEHEASGLIPQWKKRHFPTFTAHHV